MSTRKEFESDTRDLYTAGDPIPPHPMMELAILLYAHSDMGNMIRTNLNHGHRFPQELLHEVEHLLRYQDYMVYAARDLMRTGGWRTPDDADERPRTEEDLYKVLWQRWEVNRSGHKMSGKSCYTPCCT